MNCRLFVCVACATWGSLLSLPASAQSGFVLETAHELSLVANFNGDPHDDVAMADIASGAVWIALGNADGSLTWQRPAPTGIVPLTGLDAGRWASLAHDSLVFGGPYGNRLRIEETPAAAHFNPKEFTLSKPVVWRAVPIDIGGAGNSPFDDFAVLSAPGPGSATSLTTVRNPNGNPGAVLLDQPLNEVVQQLNRIALDAGPKRYLSGIFSAGNQHELRVWDFAAGPPVVTARLTNIPPNAQYVVGQFGPSETPTAVLYVPGTATLRVGRLDQPLPQVRTVTLAPALQSLLGPLLGLRLVPVSDAAPQLLAFGEKPGAAALLSFDGEASFTLVQTLPLPGSGAATGALVMQDGSVHLLTGADGHSQNFHRFRRVGSNYQVVQSDSLPRLSPDALGANVFQFDREPFVDPQPGLLYAEHVPDWSSVFVLGGNVGVTQEAFVNSAQGLDNPLPVQLGPPQPGTSFGLVNQYHEALSLFSVSTALGPTVSPVTLSPPAGTYRTGIAVSFQKPVGHQVFFRFHVNEAWRADNGKPVPIFADTTVEYYGQPLLGNAKSPIYRAHYAFQLPPERIDSDEDGVPDFVEVHLQLDPHAGADTDGDSFTDAEEIQAGTNPGKATSKPAQRNVAQADAGRTFAVQPRPLHPVTGSPTGVVAHASVRLQGLDGNLLGSAQTPVTLLLDPPQVPTALIRHVRPDAGLPFLVAATDPHFGLQGDPANGNRGRELVRLVRLAPAPAPTVNFDYGTHGGDLTSEATAWISAFQSALSASPLPTESLPLTPRDGLVARLFERGVALSLTARGETNGTNLTLYPFRLPEAGRWTPPLELWQRGIRFNDSTNPPAPFGIEELTTLYDRLQLQLNSPATPELAALAQLTDEVYLLSARSNHVVTNRYVLPFDALRSFIWDGALPSAYATDLPLSAERQVAAVAGVNQALASLPARTQRRWAVKWLDPQLDFAGARLFTTEEPVQPVWLFDAQGGPFQLPDSFALLPGTLLEITGYQSSASAPGEGLKVEVLSAEILSLPPAPVVDLNHNGVSDDWELLFLGGLTDDLLVDTDQDQVPDVLEFFGGSDPKDPGAVPLVPVPDIAPPQLGIKVSESGEIDVEWDAKGVLPPALANLKYVVLGGSDLDGPFGPVALHPASGTGKVALRLPPPGAATVVFYRLGLCWGNCGATP